MQTAQNTYLTAQELNLQPEGFVFNTNPARGHYKFVMSLGRCLPTTQAQARHFIKCGGPDVLNYEDVQNIEAILKAAGYVGRYKYTKSGTWVRLVNTADLKAAIKVKFGI